jgi:pilus assembly protein Flp/PilA
MKPFLARFAQDDSGVTAIEYGLIAAFIAVGLIASLMALGTNVAALFTNAGAKFQ